MSLFNKKRLREYLNERRASLTDEAAEEIEAQTRAFIDKAIDRAMFGRGDIADPDYRVRLKRRHF